MKSKDYYFVVTLTYHNSIEAGSKDEARKILDELYNSGQVIIQSIDLLDEEVTLMKRKGNTWIKDPNQPYQEYINTYDK